MFRRRLVLAVCALATWCMAESPVLALSLEDAKTKGVVGEKANGYLGAVIPPDTQARALLEDVNQKRRRAYEDIAKRNRTNVQSVESLAGEKAIQNTKTGNFVEGPGGWIKK